MPLVHLIQRGLACRSNVAIAASEDLFGGKSGQATVVVAEVVPLEVTVEPLPSMSDALEAAGIVWLILGRLELRFTERIVVADAGPAVASGNAVFAEQVQETVRDHR